MIHNGMNLRDAVALAQRLGLVVERVGTTGEIRAYDPRVPRRPGSGVRMNGRRKDATRPLVALLRRAAAAVDSAAGGDR